MFKQWFVLGVVGEFAALMSLHYNATWFLRSLCFLDIWISLKKQVLIFELTIAVWRILENIWRQLCHLVQFICWRFYTFSLFKYLQDFCSLIIFYIRYRYSFLSFESCVSFGVNRPQEQVKGFFTLAETKSIFCSCQPTSVMVHSYQACVDCREFEITFAIRGVNVP